MTEDTTGEDVLEADQQSTGSEIGQEKPKLDLTVEVDSPSACQRHITVTISREDVDRYFNEAVGELMPQASVPGFRPGRAPRKLVESRFRKEMNEQIKSSLLMDSLAQITEDQDLSAISEPDFDFEAVDIPDEGPMTFEFDLEVRPEFTTPDWKGLDLEQPAHTYDEGDVDKHLKRLLKRTSQFVTHEGAAEAEDSVLIDLSFHFDGEEISTSENQTVQILPVLSFRDGKLSDFDKLMTGASAGDTRESTVTISADAEDERIRDNDVDVKITVREIKRQELPELTSDALKRLGGFEDEEQLRSAIQNDLERQLQYHQQRRVREQITAVLTESAAWELPPDLLRRQSHRELERAVMELESSGFDEQAIRAHENELRQNVMATTERALKEHFILEKIADEENIDVTEEDFEVEIATIAMQRNESPRRVRANLEKRGSMDVLRNQIVERKVIQQITSQAKFKEVDFQPDENQVEAINIAVSGESGEVAIPEAKHAPETEGLRQPTDRT